LQSLLGLYEIRRSQVSAFAVMVSESQKSEKTSAMGKSDNDGFAVRRSFSHTRVKPLVVEKLKRRPMGPICPSCGSKMKLVLGVADPTGTGKTAASCPRCADVNVDNSTGR